MSNSKISALASASTPLAGTEVLPIVQSGVTKKVTTDDLTVKNIRSNATSGILQITGPAAASTRIATVPDANWTAARTDAAQSFTGDQTLSTGNLIVSNGKGVDFSATPGTGTSELLADYEEGTWTPTVTSASGTITSYTLTGANYTKTGRTVNVNVVLTITNAGTGAGALQITLPFTNGAVTACGVGRENALTGYELQASVLATSATMSVFTYANLTPIGTNAQIRLSLAYFV